MRTSFIATVRCRRSSCAHAKLIAATGSDKKNVGGVRRFVLPIGIGDAGVIEDLQASELQAAVSYMLSQAKEPRA